MRANSYGIPSANVRRTSTRTPKRSSNARSSRPMMMSSGKRPPKYPKPQPPALPEKPKEIRAEKIKPPPLPPKPLNISRRRR